MYRFLAFNCRMNKEQLEPKKVFSNFLVKKKKRILDQKSQFSEISPKLDCNIEIYIFTEKETIM